MNIATAKKILEKLAAQGVREVVLCAGARNSPLVCVLENSVGFHVYSFFEERSAAFFALGRIKNHGLPVAVLTTSGTAAAELFPAVIEAYFSGAPLILVTADRPRRLRGTGAPQCIDQMNLFGNHVEYFIDVAAGEDFGFESWNGYGPLHLNICFDEPLIDEPIGNTSLTPARFLRENLFRDHTIADHLIAFKTFLQDKRCPVFIIGPLHFSERATVRDFLLRTQAPVYAEALSGLREDLALAPQMLISGESILDPSYFDSVVRIGGVPTTRFWRDLENNSKLMPVFSINSNPFAGLSHSQFFHTDLRKLLAAFDFRLELDLERIQKVLTLDKKRHNALMALMEREPQSEVALIHRLSYLVEEDATIYLGNSLPIREWDLVAARHRQVHWEVSGNRGANGIDGQVSTYLGFASEDTPNWGIFGDLTTLYDLAAAWILQQRPLKKTRLVVINNSGGQIFARLFKTNSGLNCHQLNFAAWAQMWGMEYEKWTAIVPTFSNDSPTVIEIVPEAQASGRFWDSYDELVKTKFRGWVELNNI